MIILIDAQQAFGIIKNLIIIKMLRKVEIQGNLLNLINGILHLILHFLRKIRNKKLVSALSTLIQHMTRISKSANGQEKK